MPFIKKIITASKVPATVSGIIKKIATQNTFLQTKVQPVLTAAEATNDGSLDANDFKKISGYYGLAVPAILGEAICILHNKKMSDAERIASTSQGAMTGLFDDFFDKQYLPDHYIENMLQTNAKSKRSNEILFLHFYKQALQYVPSKEKMLEKLMDVYQAQLESKKQAQPLSEDEIQQISLYKGGASLLFYRTAFSPAPSKKEEKLLYNFGGLMQVANDIFDVYKDRENGIKTLVTETKHIATLRHLFLKELTANNKEAYEMGFPKKSVAQFLSILSLGIFSRAFVCLDRLEKNEASTKHVFAVHEYSRKQLICDMDTRKNQMKSAIHHVKLLAGNG
ncbi:MAG: class 1 isoprenoid biosynthesis enzyme [Ferruginibacter sp.]